jgi:hypothetical protein
MGWDGMIWYGRGGEGMVRKAKKSKEKQSSRVRDSSNVV